jgi:dihydrolipoamide dehydrogenase
METTCPNIYAIGDATGGVQLAHVAMEAGVVAAENIMGIERELEDHPIPLCIFTCPEIASIGLTEKAARTRGEVSTELSQTFAPPLYRNRNIPHRQYRRQD